MKIPTDVLVQCSQVGTLVLGSLGVWVAMLNQRRQLNAQMFITVTGRFQELLRLFPTEAWLANRSASQPVPPRSHEITDCTLYCLQLMRTCIICAKEVIFRTNSGMPGKEKSNTLWRGGSFGESGNG